MGGIPYFRADHFKGGGSGEGKSTIALSLAVSAVSAHQRVLLVDCDLRRPQVTKTFRLEKRPGLVDLLIHADNNDQVIIRDPTTGIYVLPAGSSTQNPSDLLGSARMKTLLEHVRDAFDYVILDSPPVGPVIDPVILSQIADKVVFVVTWNQTPRELVERGIQQFQSERKLAGIVLNRVDLSRSQHYGGHYMYSKYYDKYYTS